MAWKYFKITSGGSSSTEFNPKEFNILAGATQCQVGGTIESDRAPMWSTLATVIDGSLTTATYWPAGTNPTCILTMPAAHSDLTAIEIHHTFSHRQHSVWLSVDSIDWIVCPFINSVGSTQNFSIPALPVTAQNFTANAELNISPFYDQGQSVIGTVGQPTENEYSFEFSRTLQNYVMVGHQDTLNIQSQMTMEFWIKLKPLPNDFQVILDKGNISTSQYYVIHEGRNGNNQIKYRFGNGPERTLNRPTSIINNWTHMAFVHDGNVMEYYENGELIISESFPVTYSNNFEDLTFGKMSTSDGGYLDAFLDEIRIWKIARNANEIKNNYNLNVNPDNPDLLGYWTFNEGSGMFVEDMSPNFHNGYVFGDITFSTDTPIFSQNNFLNVPIHWINGQNVSISNGNVTKISGGASWNAGANSSQLSDGTTNFIIEYIPDSNINTRIAFGLDEYDDPIEYDTKDIDFSWEINPNGLTEVHVNGDNFYNGTYEAGDIFQVALINGVIFFYQNGQVIYENIATINFPIFADCSIHGEGQTFNGSLYIENQSQTFEQTAQLNIGMSEAAAKTYTANGYNHSGWSLNYLDFYYYTDQVYTPNGYEYEQTATEAQGLTQTAAQDYTANGYEFIGADSQEIIFDFGAVQAYTPEGYEFQQNTQENIFVDYIGAQTFTAEGYDVAAMAQENILLVSIAAQVYTPNGYHYEATTGELIPALTDEATQEFAAHFEQEGQENINLTIQAAQEFAAHFESQDQILFALDFGASQNYTAIGYTNETSTSESINLDIGAAQVFAAHFEQFGTELITMGEVTNTEYQANFIANASQNIFVIQNAAQTFVRSNGLQFGTNSQDNINITYGAAQEFTPFGGYSFNQNGANTVNLSMAASLLYELGEIGKYSQRATLFLNLQESVQKTYTLNWLDFESNAAEPLSGLTIEATTQHTEAHIFEANAAEVLTYFISPLQFYGQHLEGTDQQNIGLSMSATSDYSNVFNEYEATTLETFYLHHTDKSLHEIVYLSYNQSMYYDFWFWHYADSLHAVGFKEFTGQASEIINLTMAASVQYTNANMLNGFATENINLTIAAHVEHIEATIYEFNEIVTEDIDLNLVAASEHIVATIYEFAQKANESMAIAFGAVSEHIEAHIFTHEITENITLLMQEASDYQNINPFASKANDLLMFEHWATFEVTTEPRNYEAIVDLTIKLKIVNWVYFESDIYIQTYKIEVKKPNTIWEPADEDRPTPYIFGRNPDNKIDRRILSLTDITEPKKISYEKPNSLYTEKLELERGLVDD